MKVKTFLKSKQGSMSLLFVILAFISILVITGFVDMVGKAFAIDEVQSIMDVAGNSALQAGVDKTKLRVEIFNIDESFVKSSYLQQVKIAVNAGSNRLIKNLDISPSNIKLKTINGTWGLGQTSKSRPQAILDVVAKVQITSSSVFDNISSIQNLFYSSLSNSSFQISYNGITQDGNIELIIRSVNRIVYR